MYEIVGVCDANLASVNFDEKLTRAKSTPLQPKALSPSGKRIIPELFSDLYLESRKNVFIEPF